MRMCAIWGRTKKEHLMIKDRNATLMQIYIGDLVNNLLVH